MLLSSDEKFKLLGFSCTKQTQQNCKDAINTWL